MRIDVRIRGKGICGATAIELICVFVLFSFFFEFYLIDFVWMAFLRNVISTWDLLCGALKAQWLAVRPTPPIRCMQSQISVFCIKYFWTSIILHAWRCNTISVLYIFARDKKKVHDKYIETGKKAIKTNVFFCIRNVCMRVVSERVNYLMFYRSLSLYLSTSLYRACALYVR